MLQHFSFFNTLDAGYEYIIHLEIGLESSIFQLSYQPHSSSTDCTRKLLQPSKDSASLLVCNEKIFSGFGFKF